MSRETAIRRNERTYELKENSLTQQQVKVF